MSEMFEDNQDKLISKIKQNKIYYIEQK